MANEDFKALMSSGIFKEFASNCIGNNISDSNVWKDFFRIEGEINKSADLKSKFKNIQQKLIEDSSYYNKADKKFAEIILMMDFEK